MGKNLSNAWHWLDNLVAKVHRGVVEFSSRPVNFMAYASWGVNSPLYDAEKTIYNLYWSKAMIDDIVRINPVDRIFYSLIDVRWESWTAEIREAIKNYEKLAMKRKARIALNGEVLHSLVFRHNVSYENGVADYDSNIDQVIKSADSLDTALATFVMAVPQKPIAWFDDQGPHYETVESIVGVEKLEHISRVLQDSDMKLVYLNELGAKDRFLMWANRLPPEDHEIKAAVLEIARLVLIECQARNLRGEP